MKAFGAWVVLEIGGDIVFEEVEGGLIWPERVRFMVVE